MSEPLWETSWRCVGHVLVSRWGQGWRRSRSALAWLGSCGGRTRPPALGSAPWWTPSSPSWACCSRLTCNSRPGTLKPNTTQVSVPLRADLYATKIKIRQMLCGRCKSAGEGGKKRGRGKRNNGSCQSHFIVQSLFMKTLSGWKDSRAATHVSDCGSWLSDCQHGFNLSWRNLLLQMYF